jgi:DNA-binding response OmpR family regulator
LKEKALILTVEDEPAIQNLISDILEEDGYLVDSADDGASAILKTKELLPDLALIDLKLPGIDGFEVCRSIRQFSPLPLVAVSALKSISDRKRFIDLGGNDFITKPFKPNELKFRVWANLRSKPDRTALATSYDDGYLRIDPRAREVTINGKEIAVRGREYSVLLELALHEGVALDTSRILANVWGTEYDADSNILYVAITHLRNQIEPDPAKPKYITTIPRYGYRFQRPAASRAD